jgi:hypothetical protein
MKTNHKYEEDDDEYSKIMGPEPDLEDDEDEWDDDDYQDDEDYDEDDYDDE